MHLMVAVWTSRTSARPQKAPHAARCQRAPSSLDRHAAQTNATAIRSSSSADGIKRSLPQKRAISPAAMTSATEYAAAFNAPIAPTLLGLGSPQAIIAGGHYPGDPNGPV